VFLDRDGTINEDVGDLFDIEKLQFIPRSIEAMKMLQEKFLLFIETNQTGIARRDFTMEQYNRFNDQFLNILHDNGILIQKSYCCPHLIEDGCVCRKPSTYFLKQAEMEFGIDLTKSYTIGDHGSDIELGLNAGAKSVYVLTGHGSKHLNELEVKPHHICNNLFEAAVWILNSSLHPSSL
jgi:D-glycero-D-manno-heptose 1,7-bisphosphate phosphatase